MAKRDNKELSGAVAWVPQVFYDIIARLIPGATVIGSFALAVIGPQKSWNALLHWLRNGPSTTLFIIAGVVASYSLAIVLRGLWFLLGLLGRRVAGKAKSRRKTMVYDEDDFRKKYDWIKLTNSSIGNRITKVRAESSMARILILGFSGSFAVNLLKLCMNLEISRAILGGVLLGAIAGSVGAWHIFFLRAHMAVETYAEFLQYQGTTPREQGEEGAQMGESRCRPE